jgi:hypothetical protein
VPAVPCIGLESIAAVWSAIAALGSISWPVLRSRLPAVAGTLALAALAAISERVPHLLR